MSKIETDFYVKQDIIDRIRDYGLSKEEAQRLSEQILVVVSEFVGENYVRKDTK